MEFALLPFHRGDPPIPIPKTPYISKERYDGGPWRSYPSRRSQPLSGWDGETFDIQEYYRSQRVNPTPVAELESFAQTWLYFGLLSEFLCVDISELGVLTSTVDKPESKAIVKSIYDATLLQVGDEQYVNLTSDCLNSFLQSTRPRLPKDREIIKKFYEHLNLCLSCTRSMLAVLPPEFNHAVKYSIAALGELLMHTVNIALKRLGVKPKFGSFWGKGFYNEEAKKSMKDHGWCVSDITRIEAKYKSFQGLYVARMMDKSLPKRNHESCTEYICKFFQIDMGAFQLQHQQEGCLCDPLEVDSGELTTVLRKDNKFPLLRFTGDLHGLNAEVVESKPEVPYVAISHVWADGLGNPNSNALHRCKLHYLRRLVASIDGQDPTHAHNEPYIWLDTLCSPAQDGDGKQLAIEKLRLVYKQAKHVLVLDAGLMSYDASEHGEFEHLVRIFTSGWMRRLWTLQEGALANSLYFQFADKAVSLEEVINTLFKKCNHMKYNAIFADLWHEYQGLISFFHRGQDLLGDTDLATLDQSLHFRSVSVPTDEPLCIGTLLSLNLRDILDVKEKSDRMQKVWELVAAKLGGFPMQVIFFQEPGIGVNGWRWAPQSLLAWSSGNHELVNTRVLKWNDKRLGKITDQGLRVQYAGYRIKIASETGEARPQLWPGFPRLPEFHISFRVSDTGEWYRIFDQTYGLLNQTWTEEERKAHNKLELYPLHDIAETGDAGLLFNSSMNTMYGMHDALFGTIVTDHASASLEEGLAVRTGQTVIVSRAGSQNAYVYDTLRRLAINLRTDDLATKHKEIYRRVAEECHGSPDLLKTATENSKELQASIKHIREKMKRMVEEVAATDDKFVKAVEESGEAALDSVWVWLYDFVAHDYVGEKRGPEQVWFVD